jgi:hypothetical protein
MVLDIIVHVLKSHYIGKTVFGTSPISDGNGSFWIRIHDTAFLSSHMFEYLQVSSYTGADGVDDWNEARWQDEFAQNQVWKQCCRSAFVCLDLVQAQNSMRIRIHALNELR